MKVSNTCKLWVMMMLLSSLTTISFARPKNVIIMISDGCGANQIAADNMWNHTTQPYEDFPVKLWMSTYSWTTLQGDPKGYDPDKAWSNFSYLLQRPTDSAASATAISTGVKTYDAAIGLDPDDKPLLHLSEHAKSIGMAAGTVTSVPFCHATPAGFVAHNTDRYNYEQIADEMINEAKCDLFMGTGNPLFDNSGNSVGKWSRDYKYVGSQQNWDALTAGTAGADIDSDGTPDPWTLIQTKQDFINLQSGDTPKRVLGIPQVMTSLQFYRSGAPSDGSTQAPYYKAFIKNVPTLVDMAAGALNVLDNNPNGFFVMIEGGAIDLASHSNLLGRMIEEEDDFNATVQMVIHWIETNSNWDETLLIVTADHETGFLWGPNSKGSTFNPLTDNGLHKMPGFKYYATEHSNQLIPFFAKGYGAERFIDAAVGQDTKCGAYMDNTDISKLIMIMLDEEEGVPAVAPLPVKFKLLSVYPNPFNPTGTVSFTLGAPGLLSGGIYDIAGRMVAPIADGSYSTGEHKLSLGSQGLASGMYFVKLNCAGETVTTKIAVEK